MYIIKEFALMIVSIAKLMFIVGSDILIEFTEEFTEWIKRTKTYKARHIKTLCVVEEKEKPIHIIMRHAKQIKPSAALSCCLIIAMGIMCFSMYGKLNNIQNEMETAIYYSPDFIEEEEVMVYPEEGELTIEPTTTITEPPTATEAAITEATTTEVITTTTTNTETSSSTNTTTTATTTQPTTTTTSAPPPTTTPTTAKAEATPVQNAKPENTDKKIKAGQTYKVSLEGCNFIASYEGRKEKEPYKCEAGCWTIGYGHAYTSQESRSWSREKALAEFNKDIEKAIGADYKITKSHPRLSNEEAMMLLQYDLNNGEYKRKLDKFIEKNDLILTQYQYDAMISFAYNCGAGVWEAKANKFRDKLLEYKDGSKIPAATVKDLLDNWCHVGDSVCNGLLYRRWDEAEMFCNGDCKRDY